MVRAPAKALPARSCWRSKRLRCEHCAAYTGFRPCG